MNSYLTPLFWQHHESAEVLREEIDKMKSVGIDSFIVEARPHPDYLAAGWWEDLTIIIDQAKKREMKVWLFDDSDYPSGYANGLIEASCPEHCKRYLAVRPLDAHGPLLDASFLIGDWVYEGEELVSVIAGKRVGSTEIIEEETLQDITSMIQNGRLYWEVPEGRWRLFILVNTRDGGEPHTRSYVNPVSMKAVSKFIEFIYEPHYRYFKDDFGQTIAGFFSDEPRFGNAVSYEFELGDESRVLPWSEEVFQGLNKQSLKGVSLLTKLPLLWYQGDQTTPDVRYLYMDLVSKLFSECFINQIQDWCHERQVELIGHLIEENGAHSRLGYGPGHFFRGMSGFDIAGMDNVCNLYPGQREGHYKTHFNYFDGTFNHWGLAKLTSSVASLDKNKKGRALCEAFGAYGWSEGLKTMKWITDVLCVRGITIITPHAFSPKEYPDLDCPPHFYARGMNPQWPFFDIWSNYANRVCENLSEGRAITPIAVLYHAEAQWGGQAQPFEAVVKALMENLIDSTVISCDHLIHQSVIKKQTVMINEMVFRAIVIPYSEYLPKDLVDKLKKIAEAGIPVYFCQEYPVRLYGGYPFDKTGFKRVLLEELPSVLTNLADITGEGKLQGLSYRHYLKDDQHCYFLVNEQRDCQVNGWLTVEQKGPCYLYDPLNNVSFSPKETVTAGKRKIAVSLKPYQSMFIMFSEKKDLEQVKERKVAPFIELDQWEISLKSFDETTFSSLAETKLRNFSAPDWYPDFSGTIRYKTHFTNERRSELLLDMGRVYEVVRVLLNGQEISRLICPPYEVVLPSEKQLDGKNELVIEVTNTLVKANHTNIYDRYWPQEPSGLLGKVMLLK
ncbi:hypothetical protein I6N95_12850 [Vagococcus sp. BWB3-3]|uniref:Glycoside hydrolase n=1 Tax=Vagococcus allomyrinae TaxID=2794353 RepID=A0A940PE94_9ENTE|nr:hypothetical protein [Vagococcus allomyrinae]MBP1041901.1 hypothetical protein [Vagococcus allomyrinae]